MANSESHNVPFETLRDYEKRSLVHAVGLPEQASAHWAWSGIAFRLADANLVCEISDIVEILTLPELTRIPGSKFWILGVANVRGTLVPVVDLRGFLTGERTVVTKYTRVLVAQMPGGVVGLLVDEIAGQRHFQDDEETDEPLFAEHMAGAFIRRQFRKGEEPWGAFNMYGLGNSPDFLAAAA